MKFNKTINISIGSSAIKTFKEFEKIRPNNISFSLFLTQAMYEFISNHNNKINTDESIHGKVPAFLAPIDKWRDCVPNLDTISFKSVQQRHVQIGNIVNKEVMRRF